MDAREKEKMLLDRCVFVAQHPDADTARLGTKSA